MKVDTLARGLGARVVGEKSKPMIAIGEQPILWYIMQ